jgi:excisionase family DNA binding protein
MELLDQRDIAKLFKASERTVERWRESGGGPPYFRIGRLIRYNRTDFEAWLVAQLHHTKSDAVETVVFGTNRLDMYSRDRVPSKASPAGPVARADR